MKPAITDPAIAVLRAHSDEMSKLFGVRALRVFGSVARGTSRSDSDIDLLVDLEPPCSAKRFYGLQVFLEDLLQRRVDLISEKALRQEFRQGVEKDAIRV